MTVLFFVLIILQSSPLPPADENGDIGTSDRVGQDESLGTN